METVCGKKCQCRHLNIFLLYVFTVVGDRVFNDLERERADSTRGREVAFLCGNETK